jgi:hypothetical protein
MVNPPLLQESQKINAAQPWPIAALVKIRQGLKVANVRDKRNDKNQGVQDH